MAYRYRPPHPSYPVQRAPPPPGVKRPYPEFLPQGGIGGPSQFPKQPKPLLTEGEITDMEIGESLVEEEDLSYWEEEPQHIVPGEPSYEESLPYESTENSYGDGTLPYDRGEQTFEETEAEIGIHPSYTDIPIATERSLYERPLYSDPPEQYDVGRYPYDLGRDRQPYESNDRPYGRVRPGPQYDTDGISCETEKQFHDSETLSFGLERNAYERDIPISSSSRPTVASVRRNTDPRILPLDRDRHSFVQRRPQSDAKRLPARPSQSPYDPRMHSYGADRQPGFSGQAAARLLDPKRQPTDAHTPLGELSESVLEHSLERSAVNPEVQEDHYRRLPPEERRHLFELGGGPDIDSEQASVVYGRHLRDIERRCLEPDEALSDYTGHPMNPTDPGKLPSHMTRRIVGPLRPPADVERYPLTRERHSIGTSRPGVDASRAALVPGRPRDFESHSVDPDGVLSDYTRHPVDPRNPRPPLVDLNRCPIGPTRPASDLERYPVTTERHPVASPVTGDRHPMDSGRPDIDSRRASLVSGLTRDVQRHNMDPDRALSDYTRHLIESSDPGRPPVILNRRPIGPRRPLADLERYPVITERHTVVTGRLDIDSSRDPRHPRDLERHPLDPDEALAYPSMDPVDPEKPPADIARRPVGPIRHADDLERYPVSTEKYPVTADGRLLAPKRHPLDSGRLSADIGRVVEPERRPVNSRRPLSSYGRLEYDYLPSADVAQRAPDSSAHGERTTTAEDQLKDQALKEVMDKIKYYRSIVGEEMNAATKNEPSRDGTPEDNKRKTEENRKREIERHTQGGAKRCYKSSRGTLYITDEWQNEPIPDSHKESSSESRRNRNPEHHRSSPTRSEWERKDSRDREIERLEYRLKQERERRRFEAVSGSVHDYDGGGGYHSTSQLSRGERGQHSRGFYGKYTRGRGFRGYPVRGRGHYAYHQHGRGSFHGNVYREPRSRDGDSERLSRSRSRKGSESSDGSSAERKRCHTPDRELYMGRPNNISVAEKLRRLCRYLKEEKNPPTKPQHRIQHAINNCKLDKEVKFHCELLLHVAGGNMHTGTLKLNDVFLVRGIGSNRKGLMIQLHDRAVLLLQTHSVDEILAQKDPGIEALREDLKKKLSGQVADSRERKRLKSAAAEGIMESSVAMMIETLVPYVKRQVATNVNNENAILVIDKAAASAKLIMRPKYSATPIHFPDNTVIHKGKLSIGELVIGRSEATGKKQARMAAYETALKRIMSETVEELMISVPDVPTLITGKLGEKEDAALPLCERLDGFLMELAKMKETGSYVNMVDIFAMRNELTPMVIYRRACDQEESDDEFSIETIQSDEGELEKEETISEKGEKELLEKEKMEEDSNKNQKEIVRETSGGNSDMELDSDNEELETEKSGKEVAAGKEEFDRVKDFVEEENKKVFKEGQEAESKNSEDTIERKGNKRKKDNNLITCDLYIEKIRIASSEGTAKRECMLAAYKKAWDLLLLTDSDVLMTEHQHITDEEIRDPRLLEVIIKGTGRVVEDNKGGLKRFGFTVEQVAEKTLEDLVIVEHPDWCDSRMKNAFCILQLSCNQSGLLMQWEVDVNQKVFRCVVSVQNQIVGEGCGSSKSFARNLASLEALMKFYETQDAVKISPRKNDPDQWIPWETILSEARELKQKMQSLKELLCKEEQETTNSDNLEHPLTVNTAGDGTTSGLQIVNECKFENLTEKNDQTGKTLTDNGQTKRTLENNVNTKEVSKGSDESKRQPKAEREKVESAEESLKNTGEIVDNMTIEENQNADSVISNIDNEIPEEDKHNKESRMIQTENKKGETGITAAEDIKSDNNENPGKQAEDSCEVEDHYILEVIKRKMEKIYAEELLIGTGLTVQIVRELRLLAKQMKLRCDVLQYQNQPYLVIYRRLDWKELVKVLKSKGNQYGKFTLVDKSKLPSKDEVHTYCARCLTGIDKDNILLQGGENVKEIDKKERETVGKYVLKVEHGF